MHRFNQTMAKNVSMWMPIPIIINEIVIGKIASVAPSNDVLCFIPVTSPMNTIKVPAKVAILGISFSWLMIMPMAITIVPINCIADSLCLYET